MKQQVINFDGLKESEIDKLLLNHPYMKEAIIEIAYAGYSKKMKERIIQNAKQK